MLRYGWIVALACVAGCWSEDTVNGFTAEQWRALQTNLKFDTSLPVMDLCARDSFDLPHCQLAHNLGKRLFSEVGLSSTGNCRPDGGISCASCHQGPGWIDTRTTGPTSMGVTKLTGRNSMSVLNERYKWWLAKGREVFTWSGGSAPDPDHRFTTPGQVLRLAIEKPMNNTTTCVEQFVSGPTYFMDYEAIFNNSQVTFANLEKVFDAYFILEPPLQTDLTPFDHWLNGDATTISDSAKRGFELFVGKAGCIACHSGPLFSDLDYHDTGVKPSNSAVPDNGRAIVTMDPADVGKFLTGQLRDIASTGPYMHDGLYMTLHDVIDFYRRGGDGGIGTRDARIQPLDLTEGDEADLEAFLRSLSDCDDTKSCTGGGGSGSGGSGMPMIDASTGSGSGMPDASVCSPPDMLCPAGCVAVMSDPSNCGTCGHVCTYPMLTCTSGQCVQ